MTNLLWFVIISLLFIVALTLRLEWYISYLLGLVTMALAMVSAWNYITLRCITYIIEMEQIIIKHGVFNRYTNYLELYRVYDYQKRQNIFESAFGLMNVVLLSRDVSHPKILFLGLTNNDDVIPLIRNRVEIEKRRKNIVEFNNPFGGIV
jgi:membrane protein YdbS with pleckstrin-like domain